MKFFSWSSSKLTYSSQYSEKGDRISKNSGIFEQALKLIWEGKIARYKILIHFFFLLVCCACFIIFSSWLIETWSFLREQVSVSAETLFVKSPMNWDLERFLLLNFYILLKGKEKFES